MNLLDNPNIPLPLRVRAADAALAYVNAKAAPRALTDLLDAIRAMIPLAAIPDATAYTVAAKEAQIGADKVNELKGHIVRQHTSEHNYPTDHEAYDAILAHTEDDGQRVTMQYMAWQPFGDYSHEDFQQVLEDAYEALLSLVVNL